MVHLRPGIPLRTLTRSEEHTSELQSQSNLVCRLLLEKKKNAPSLCPRQLSRHRRHALLLLIPDGYSTFVTRLVHGRGSDDSDRVCCHRGSDESCKPLG